MNPVFFLLCTAIVLMGSTAIIIYVYRLNRVHGDSIKALELENNILNEALSCTDEYLWRIDLETNELWLQEGFLSAIGRAEHKNLTTQDLRGLIYEEDVAKLEELVIRSKQAIELVQSTIRLINQEGQPVWVHVSAKIVRDEIMNPLFITGAIMDVTTLVATEDALHESHKTLEKTKQMNASFLARMSHEIRTPLNAISGYVQLIEREVDDDGVKAHISVVKESTNQLVDVMSEIIEAGRLEAGEISLKIDRVNLNHMMDYYERAFLEQANKKGLDLKIEVVGRQDYVVLTDEVRMNQILYNLVSNAIKYTDRGLVKLSLESRKYSYNKLELKFTIDDSGRGINNKRIIDYINSEMNTDAINMVTENGLGLSIVYNLVKMMKGDLHVVSSREVGTTFEVIFRVSIATGKSLFDDSSRVVVKHAMDLNKRILIAEDNEVNQTLMADILRMFKLSHFDLAKDGKEALDLFNRNEYQLVITDIQMPYMTGSEVARAIRVKDDETPIIAMTANILEEQLSEYYAAGINDYVAKPVNVNDLKLLLDKYLS